MTERGFLRVELVEAIGVLIDEGVVLRNKLPTNFRWIDLSSCGTGLRDCSHFLIW